MEHIRFKFCAMVKGGDVASMVVELIGYQGRYSLEDNRLFRFAAPSGHEVSWLSTGNVSEHLYLLVESDHVRVEFRDKPKKLVVRSSGEEDAGYDTLFIGLY